MLQSFENKNLKTALPERTLELLIVECSKFKQIPFFRLTLLRLLHGASCYENRNLSKECWIILDFSFWFGLKAKRVEKLQFE